MKKLTFGLVAAVLVLGVWATPVTTRAFTASDIPLLQQLLRLLTDLQQQLIRLLAHRNPPANLVATSTLPMTTAPVVITPAQNQATPVITSIAPSSGPVGTVVVLHGQNLAGFEGDLDAWIMNSAGQLGYLPAYGPTVYPRTDQITVQLTAQVCQQNNGYSGLPCASYLKLVPGTYQIFTEPWGKKSNSVNFNVTEL